MRAREKRKKSAREGVLSKRGCRLQMSVVDNSTLARLLMQRSRSVREFIEPRIPEKLQHILDADDILQDVWLAAFRSQHDRRPGNDRAADQWILTIARNTLLNAVRDTLRLKRGGDRAQQGPAADRSASFVRLYGQLISPHRTPSSVEAAAEVVHAVRISLCTLPEAQQRAVKLYHIDGRSTDETARKMRRTPAAIRGLLRRALQRLKGQLGSAGRFFRDAPMDERALEE